MDPRALIDLCMQSIDRWNADGGTGPEPTILLVLPRERCPTGDTVALLGRRGPRGRIATIRETLGGYDVAAYFPAVAVIDEIARAIGMPSPVMRMDVTRKGRSAGSNR